MPVAGYEPLPEWVKEGEEPDERCRDEVNGAGDSELRNAAIPAADRLGAAIKGKAPSVGHVVAGKGITAAEGKQPLKEKTLDDWLAEEDDDDDEDESEEEDESEDDDDDDGSDDGEDSDEDEDPESDPSN